MYAQKRKIRNMLLQPGIQLAIGFYAIITGAVFSCIAGLLVYFHLGQFVELIVSLTDLEDLVRQEFAQYIKDALPTAIILILLFLLTNLAIAILYTHRLVGPTYAFHRHIRELMAGNFSSRVSLRKRDVFSDLAENLNELAEWLEKASPQGKETPKRDT